MTRRTIEALSSGKISADETEHYSGPGSTPSWSSEISGAWKRNITGINGNLAAIDNNGETLLELPNLHGDIIATVHTSETATGLASTIKESSEYGVPATEAPPKYSWLGAHEIPTTLPSGVMAMGARSYVPQLGRFLQTDPIPGGTNNSYAYTNGDPLNETDLTGMYDATISTLLIEANNQEASEAVARAIAAEEAARAEAERQAAIAAAYAAEAAAMHAEWAAEGAAYASELYGYEGGEEEYWEEEGEYEYASYHQDTKPGKEEVHIEPGLLYQPLGAEINEGAKEESEARSRIFVAGGCPSTHDPCSKHISHHSGKANEGSACGRRSGCRGQGGDGSDCPAMTFVTMSPGIWTPAGWVGIAVGEVYCAASGGD